MVLWSHCLQGQTLSNKMAHFFCNKTNLNEQLKSILGSQIICINICTSLAKSHMNCFITKGNARFDFSFPWILTYTWLKITFVWNPIYFCFLCINTHTHTHTDIHHYVHMCIYTHMHTHGKKLQVKTKCVPCSLNFTALSHWWLSLERGVHIKLTNKYVKSRIIVKQNPKIKNKAHTHKIKHKTYINKNCMKISTCPSQ